MSHNDARNKAIHAKKEGKKLKVRHEGSHMSFSKTTKRGLAHLKASEGRTPITLEKK